MTRAEIKSFYEEQIEWHTKQVEWILKELEFIKREIKWSKTTYGFLSYKEEQNYKKERQQHYRSKKYHLNAIEDYKKRLAAI